MTSKTKTILAAWFAGITGFLGYIATLPVDTQTGVFAAIDAALPPAWRAQIGSALKLAAMFAGIYASYHAAHSGPSTPPANTPQ